MTDLELALRGLRITTAQIYYHMPDHPDLVNWFLWQEYDHPPKLPRLHGFLKWWDANLDGKLHSVRVCVRGVIQPTDLTHLEQEFRLG
jgi:Usg protein, probable subunit of phosphoribosylanthranilate isomerase